MYTRPGQQGDEELARMAKERACVCGHTIWTHSIMDSPKRCNIGHCSCRNYTRA
jgi:hypothetical protein